MERKSVPENVEFLTDWVGFELPNGVFNKGITACGATTLAIKDEHKTIICSPRNNLIENKHAQHPETLLVTGRFPEYMITEYIDKTEHPKILVSYDSLPKVAKLIADKTEWRVVVDEFQYLLTDSCMKSEVEIRLLDSLKSFPYVTYMSATPILKKYFDKISWLKDLPYMELEWQNVEKVRLIRQQSKRPIDAALQIVRSYQNGCYPRMEINGDVVYSKECVIYLNSVKNIVDIIKQTDLQPEEVNVIVGNSVDNDKLLAKVGHKRGRIPLEGEQHKMYTFCTSTAFAGCDFYSTCASSFVISDSKRINTSIDIATDLLQIAGRQRLPENPFRKHLTFVYNLNKSELSEAEFERQLDEKLRLSKLEVADYNATNDKILRDKRIKDTRLLQKIKGYEDSFIMYDEDKEEFTVNAMAYLNERYAYDLQRHNYMNGLVVRQQLNERLYDMSEPLRYVEYEEQLLSTVKKETFAERMEHYCDCKSPKCLFGMISTSWADEFYPDMRMYYNELGGDRIKALGYKESALKNAILIQQQKPRIIYEMRNAFRSGEQWTNEQIKAKMNEIYSRLGVKKNGVATHLERDYGIRSREIKIVQADGRRKNGLEFI